VRSAGEKASSAIGRKNRSSFVMEGSMAMMLARASSVDFVGQVRYIANLLTNLLTNQPNSLHHITFIHSFIITDSSFFDLI
jgi:hypothetical protein